MANKVSLPFNFSGRSVIISNTDTRSVIDFTFTQSISDKPLTPPVWASRRNVSNSLNSTLSSGTSRDQSGFKLEPSKIDKYLSTRSLRETNSGSTIPPAKSELKALSETSSTLGCSNSSLELEEPPSVSSESSSKSSDSSILPQISLALAPLEGIPLECISKSSSPSNSSKLVGFGLVIGSKPCLLGKGSSSSSSSQPPLEPKFLNSFGTSRLGCCPNSPIESELGVILGEPNPSLIKSLGAPNSDG